MVKERPVVEFRPVVGMERPLYGFRLGVLSRIWRVDSALDMSEAAIEVRGEVVSIVRLTAEGSR